jgi:hypothetical protein
MNRLAQVGPAAQNLSKGIGAVLIEQNNPLF